MEPMLLHNKKDLLVIEAGERCIAGLAESYAHVPQGEPLAILGSRNSLEIAIRDGNAAEMLKLQKGDTVTVRIRVGTEGTCQE
jgi:S-adenosylmethionine hydrolase